MGAFFFEYGLFLAKALTVVIAIGLVLLLSVGLTRRGHAGPGLQVEKLNDRYREMALTLRRAMLPRSEWRREMKEEKQHRKAEKKDTARRRVFVLDFKGDIKATAVAALREEVSAILAVCRPGDEVVMRLENFGGAVHEHGLAASQLQRLRERQVPLTVTVDKGAASGGYLMACVANRIIAAPFAVIGSIGVIAQIPNFHRFLDARGVDFEQITAGRYKRTVTMFGRNTDEDRAKLKEELEEVHGLFRQVVAAHRPALDLDRVATGEHWYGTRARELALVDEIGASDDLLMKLAGEADLFHLSWKVRPTLQQRLLTAVRAGADELSLWLSQRNQESRFH
jgi:serine protease SohB